MCEPLPKCICEGVPKSVSTSYRLTNDCVHNCLLQYAVFLKIYRGAASYYIHTCLRNHMLNDPL